MHFCGGMFKGVGFEWGDKKAKKCKIKECVTTFTRLGGRNSDYKESVLLD